MPGNSGNSGLSGVLPFGGETYIQKVLGYGPLVYFPLWETAGVVAEELIHGWNGTYARNVTLMGTQAGIGDGNTAPIFNGAADCADVISAALIAAWNGNVGTVSIWGQVSGAGVWLDGANRIAWRADTDANNIQYIRKLNANNTLQYRHTSGGVGGILAVNPVSPLTWFHMALAWGGGTAQAYYAGAPTGAPWAIGAWAGALVAAGIGANTPAPPAAVWDGALAHCALWCGTRLTDLQIADLAIV